MRGLEIVRCDPLDLVNLVLAAPTGMGRTVVGGAAQDQLDTRIVVVAAPDLQTCHVVPGGDLECVVVRLVADHRAAHLNSREILQQTTDLVGVGREAPDLLDRPVITLAQQRDPLVVRTVDLQARRRERLEFGQQRPGFGSQRRAGERRAEDHDQHDLQQQETQQRGVRAAHRVGLPALVTGETRRRFTRR